jgi:hypothetical protein
VKPEQSPGRLLQGAVPRAAPVTPAAVAFAVIENVLGPIGLRIEDLVDAASVVRFIGAMAIGAFGIARETTGAIQKLADGAGLVGRSLGAQVPLNSESAKRFRARWVT